MPERSQPENNIPHFAVHRLRRRAAAGLGELNSEQSEIDRLFVTQPEGGRPDPKVIDAADVARGFGLPDDQVRRIAKVVHETRANFSTKGGQQHIVAARGKLVEITRAMKPHMPSDIRQEVLRRAISYWKAESPIDLGRTPQLRYGIEKAAGHKYKSRKKVGGKWVYDYGPQTSLNFERKVEEASGSSAATLTQLLAHLRPAKGGTREARSLRYNEIFRSAQKELVGKLSQAAEAEANSGGNRKAIVRRVRAAADSVFDPWLRTHLDDTANKLAKEAGEPAKKSSIAVIPLKKAMNAEWGSGPTGSGGPGSRTDSLPDFSIYEAPEYQGRRKREIEAAQNRLSDMREKHRGFWGPAPERDPELRYEPSGVEARYIEKDDPKLGISRPTHKSPKGQIDRLKAPQKPYEKIDESNEEDDEDDARSRRKRRSRKLGVRRS